MISMILEPHRDVGSSPSRERVGSMHLQAAQPRQAGPVRQVWPFLVGSKRAGHHAGPLSQDRSSGFAS